MNTPPYTFLKRKTYYFTRSIPKDLTQHYIKPRLVRCLHVHSARQAEQVVKQLNAQLEQQWLELRLVNRKLAFDDVLKTTAKASISDAPLLSEAMEFYLDLKGKDKPKVFRQTVDRAVRYLVECHDNRAISDYSSKDAALFRDALKEKGLGNGSIKKTFGVIKALLNLYISEHGLDIKNPFVGTYLEPEVVEKRLSIKGKELVKLQQACLELNDEVRLLIALISDTGMRLAEAAGLLHSDINLDADIPHVVVQVHPHRSLKTKSSIRVIPLVGTSLEAAKRLAVNNIDSSYLFPTYNKSKTTNSNTISATANKWLKTILGNDYVIHGLRHGLRDRLREVEAPLEVTDEIGGWSKKTVGQSYGSGNSLKVKQKWMLKL